MLKDDIENIVKDNAYFLLDTKKLEDLLDSF